MRCGHIADTIMTDVAYHNETMNVAACSYCFSQIRDVNQPACCMVENQTFISNQPKNNNWKFVVIIAVILFSLIGVLYGT